jgi:hypothetical protein
MRSITVKSFKVANDGRLFIYSFDATFPRSIIRNFTDAMQRNGLSIVNARFLLDSIHLTFKQTKGNNNVE